MLSLASANAPLSVREISVRSGVGTTSAYRILHALESRGATRRLSSGKHELGGLLPRLARAVDHYGELRLAAAGTMFAVRDACGLETLGLYVRLNTAEMTCIEVLPGQHSIRHVEPIGGAISISRGATSAVFLAEQFRLRGEASLAAYLTGLPPAIRPRTIEATLERARHTAEQGWAQTRGDRVAGAGALAAGVHTDSDVLMAVLTLSGPEYRFTRQAVSEWLPILRRGAAEISRAMG